MDHGGYERDTACPDHELLEDASVDIGVAEERDASRPETEKKVAERDPKAAGEHEEDQLVQQRVGQVHLDDLADRTGALDAVVLLRLCGEVLLELLSCFLLLSARRRRCKLRKPEQQARHVQHEYDPCDQERLALELAARDQEESQQRIHHQHVAAEEHRMYERNPEQNRQPPREAADEPRSFASRIVELNREAHAEQEREDREELP